MNRDKPPRQEVVYVSKSKKGGVKTEDGKAISSLNALSHGILSHRVFEDEVGVYREIFDQLREDFHANSLIERIVVERMAVHVLQLQRISHARNEFLREKIHPPVTVDRLALETSFIEVLDKGYEAEVQADTVERLMSLYHRYEVSIENRLYKAIKEHKSLK